MSRPVVVAVAAVVVCTVLGSTAVVVSGQSGVTETLEDATQSSDSAVSAVKTASETPKQYATGALIGLGVGLIIGSAAVYKYWEGKLG